VAGEGKGQKGRLPAGASRARLREVEVKRQCVVAGENEEAGRAGAERAGRGGDKAEAGYGRTNGVVA
jgi:hypothetical protein